MKNCITFIIFLLALLGTSCNEATRGKSLYETELEDKFSSLISLIDRETNLADTLYTEMYIALKAMDKDATLGDTVINRVQKLVQMDTIRDNKRTYFEAASIVYSLRKDYPNFWRVSKMMWDTYPIDSFQRLSSYAMYYTHIEQNPDSAKYYIHKSIQSAQILLQSNDDAERIDGCIGLALMNIIQGNDSNAKEIIAAFISNESSYENKEVAKSILDDFESFKADALEYK